SQAQLQQAQKMEAIGRLAGGVAHDFNNMLSVINGYAEMLSASPGLDDGTRMGLGEIQQAGRRAANLTRQLLAFSRKQIMQLQEIDLNEAVRSIEKLLRRLIGEDIELNLALAPDLGRVQADL